MGRRKYTAEEKLKSKIERKKIADSKKVDKRLKLDVSSEERRILDEKAARMKKYREEHPIKMKEPKRTRLGINKSNKEAERIKEIIKSEANEIIENNRIIKPGSEGLIEEEEFNDINIEKY